MYLRINQDYFLNNRDIGSLICVKSKNFYYNSLEEYENCIILELKYNLNYKKPTHMILLTSIGTERFVRLVVNDNDTLRDSHIGNPSISKLSSGNIPILGNETSNEKRLLSNQLIPADFNEW